MVDTVRISKDMQGFTLIEVMIVVAIIGVLAAIAYPNYQRYVISTKRADMMSEMQNIASEIESGKLAQGTYSNDLIVGMGGNYPSYGQPLYIVSFTPNPLTREWTITATPQAGQMSSDGVLTLNYLGVKCRGTTCGTSDEWR